MRGNQGLRQSCGNQEKGIHWGHADKSENGQAFALGCVVCVCVHTLYWPLSVSGHIQETYIARVWALFLHLSFWGTDGIGWVAWSLQSVNDFFSRFGYTWQKVGVDWRINLLKFHFWFTRFYRCSVQFSCSVICDSLWPHVSQHARPPCPSPTPEVHSDSRPSSHWCHPSISSSVIPFCSCPQSLPASKSFPMSQLFAWGRFRLKENWKECYRHFPKPVGPSHGKSHLFSTLITIIVHILTKDKPTWASHNKPKFIAYLRAHSSWYEFKRFE